MYVCVFVRVVLPLVQNIFILKIENLNYPVKVR